ncbi:MAG: transporter [Chloroflexi bacterium]|nr:transporter [Chloroflexota bacterium]
MHALGIGTDRFAKDSELTSRQQLLVAAYWCALSFHGGALLGVALPSQLSDLSTDAQATGLLAVLGGTAGLITMVVQPVAGALSDLSSSRWGRRRPYLVGGALVDVGGLILMAVATTLPLLFIGFLLASLGSGVSGAAYQAYIPDQVPPQQYGEASGYLGAMSMLGTIVSFGVAAIVIAPRHVASFYLITVALIAVGALITAVAIPDTPVSRAARPLEQTWRALWIEPWRHPDFSWVFATRTMMMIALYTLFTFVAFYVRDVVHVTQFVQGAAALAGAATVAALVSGVITGWLSDRIGRKILVSFASALMAAALFGLAFFHQLNVVLSLGIVFGLALGTYMAVDWALAVDVLPTEGFAAKDLGLWGLSTNLPQATAPLIGGAVLQVFAPFGKSVSYGALFFGAAVCAGASGILVWRIQGAR